MERTTGGYAPAREKLHQGITPGLEVAEVDSPGRAHHPEPQVIRNHGEHTGGGEIVRVKHHTIPRFPNAPHDRKQRSVNSIRVPAGEVAAQLAQERRHVGIGQ